MLKNKNTLVVLFPVVVIIWGIVIWKVVSSFTDEIPVLPIPKHVDKKVAQIIPKDTFSLIKLDNDPFLGVAYNKPKTPAKVSGKAPVEIEWPAIEYLGLVSDTDISSRIHVLMIEEQQHLMESGTEVDGVKLVMARQDGVILNYRGVQKEFRKNN